MQRSDWDSLAAPFSAGDVAWRVIEISPDRRSARVSPRLTPAAIFLRLDEVLGPEGWQLRYRSVNDGVACELQVAGVVRSAVASPVGDEDAEACSHIALARAAELFGMSSGGEVAWVDYDADDRQFLAPDYALSDATVHPERVESPDQPGVAVEHQETETVKPEGQQVIDRLVERLKSEGQGLAAAHLLVEYGGYGSNPDTARELYRKLRNLLAEQVENRA